MKAHTDMDDVETCVAMNTLHHCNGDQETLEQNRVRYIQRMVKLAKWLIVSLTIISLALLVTLVTLQINNGKTRSGSHKRDVVLYDPRTSVIDWQAHQNDKRWFWWALGAIVGMTNQAFSFYGLANSCRDFSKSVGSAASCIWGAVSTAIMIGGAGWKGWQTVDAINTALTNNGVSINPFSKRDESKSAERNITTVLEGFNNTDVTDGMRLIGWLWMVSDHTYYSDNAYQRRSDYNITAAPVFEVVGYGNNTYKITGLKLTNGDRKGYIQGTLDVSKREDFNEENFSNGGIEFYDQYVADEDGDKGILNQNNDWDRMYNQVLCYLGDLSGNNFIQYQMYDNNAEGTIAEGTVEPYQDQPHDFGGKASNYPNPLLENGCAGG